MSEGKIVTLTVEHRKAAEEGHSFVYPIIGGTGWEGGFQTYQVEMPPPTPIPGEGEGEGTAEEAFWTKQLPSNSWIVSERGMIAVGAPEYDAAASSSGAYKLGVWVPPKVIISRPFKSSACWKLYTSVALPFHPNEHADQCNLTSNTMTRVN